METTLFRREDLRKPSVRLKRWTFPFFIPPSSFSARRHESVSWVDREKCISFSRTFSKSCYGQSKTTPSIFELVALYIEKVAGERSEEEANATWSFNAGA